MKTFEFNCIFTFWLCFLNRESSLVALSTLIISLFYFIIYISNSHFFVRSGARGALNRTCPPQGYYAGTYYPSSPGLYEVRRLFTFISESMVGHEPNNRFLFNKNPPFSNIFFFSLFLQNSIEFDVSKSLEERVIYYIFWTASLKEKDKMFFFFFGYVTICKLHLLMHSVASIVTLCALVVCFTYRSYESWGFDNVVDKFFFCWFFIV